MSDISPRTPADSRTTLSVLMGTGDSNTLGNVHGGVIMKLCDEAGAMAAIRHARHSVVTVAIDNMAFHSPVHIGNLVTLTAEVTWVGRSSIETEVVVRAENVLTGAVTHTNTAYYVYVALDENGRPVMVPPLECRTAAERQRHQDAVERRAIRLRLREQSRSRQAAETAGEGPST